MLRAPEKRRFVLEALKDGNAAQRKAIYERVAQLAGVPYASISQRQYVLQTLRHAGLVQRISRGIYRINAEGVQALHSDTRLTKSALRKLPPLPRC